MACIRQRRGRWVLDYRDAAGVRRWETYHTKREAEDALAGALPATRQPLIPSVSTDATLSAYAERWLRLSASLKPRTLEGYREKLELHILPAFGSVKLRRLHRAAVKDLLAEKLASGLSVDTVRQIYGTLLTMLNAAVDDRIIPANPIAGLSRRLRLNRSARARTERVRAFDADQLTRFLEGAGSRARDQYPLFFLLSRTGLRLGEALALAWGDADLVRRELRVVRSLSPGGAVDTPKSGHGRTVDLSVAACRLLRAVRARASEAALAKGAPLRGYIFAAAKGEGPTPHVTVEKSFKRALLSAGLPSHYSPHSLRHTYASLLLADGVSPAYVQEQLGHASIELTVGTYGRWLRKRAPGAVDRLDARTEQAVRTATADEVVANRGEVVADGSDVERESEASRRLQVVGLQRELAERGGFEPPVQVNPAQQVSNLARSATPAPLR